MVLTIVGGSELGGAEHATLATEGEAAVDFEGIVCSNSSCNNSCDSRRANAYSMTDRSKRPRVALLVQYRISYSS